MFDGASVLQDSLQQVVGASSFFEGEYRRMSREQRKRIFASTFKWNRCRDFMVFLVGQGYLYSAHVTRGSDEEELACDTLFDVEDLDRYICKFL